MKSTHPNMRRSRLKLSLLALLSGLLMGCSASNPYYQADKPHHTPTGFQNLNTQLVPKTWLDVLQWRLTSSPAPAASANSVPQIVPDLALIHHPSQPQSTWLGHSSLLVQADGLNILTDPIFSERASPVSFAGPKRVQPIPLSPAQLPPIDIVIISHNHYDHLDEHSIKTLAQQTTGSPLFLVPLGVDQLLKSWGVEKVMPLDWWQSHTVNNTQLVFTPAQHWSARGLFDRNESLWGSWSLLSPQLNWHFAGDTGYTPIYQEIRARLAPQGFDLAFIPIGAYEPRWFMRDQHVDPYEAVTLHQDLAAKQSIAIHWGSFVMADEAINQPPKDLEKALAEKNIDPSSFRSLAIGETINAADNSSKSSSKN